MIDTNLVMFGWRNSTSHPSVLALRDFVLVDIINKPDAEQSSATVVLAREMKSRVPLVIKAVDRVEELAMHWLTGKRCKLHQNISVYYGFLHGGGNTTMYLMTEFVNGQTLYSAIREAGRFGEPEAANFTKNIARGLEFLHSLLIAHKDLKSSNIMVDRQHKRLKIIDLGCATRERPATGNSGTPQYFAPEQFFYEHDEKVDLWALGCLFIEMRTGEYAFPTPNAPLPCEPASSPNQLDYQDRVAAVLHSWSIFIQRVGTAKYLFPLVLLDFSAEAYTLLQTLLHPDPNLRPSAKKLRKDLLRRLFPADGIVNATGNVTMHKENEEEDKARKKKSNKAKAGRQQQLNHSSAHCLMTSHSSSTSSPGGHRCNNDASDSSSSKIAIHGEGSSVTEQRLGDDEEKLCWRLDQWLFDDNDGDSAAGAMRREELLTAGSPYKKDIATDSEWVASNRGLTRNYFNPLDPVSSDSLLLAASSADVIEEILAIEGDSRRHRQGEEDEERSPSSASDDDGVEETNDDDDGDGDRRRSGDDGCTSKMVLQTTKFFPLPSAEDRQVGRQLHDYLFISMLQDRRDAPPDTTAASTEEAVPRNTSLVFIARERKSLCPVVLKGTRKPDVALEEIRTLLKLRRSNAHKHHIVSLLQLFIDENCRPDEVFSVRPYIDGRSLESLMLGPGYGGDVKLIDGERCFDLETAAKYTFQLADAIVHVHGLGLCHRNLNPANVLIDKRSKAAQLIGFGKSTENFSNLSDATVNVLEYRAPEMLLGQNYDGCRADIWSLGRILYVMLSRLPRRPTQLVTPSSSLVGDSSALGWTVPDRDDLLDHIRKVARPPDWFPAAVTSEEGGGAMRLIKSMLRQNPVQRPTAIDVYGDYWLQKTARRKLSSQSQKAKKQLTSKAAPTSSNINAVTVGTSLCPVDTFLERRDASRCVDDMGQLLPKIYEQPAKACKTGLAIDTEWAQHHVGTIRSWFASIKTREDEMDQVAARLSGSGS